MGWLFRPPYHSLFFSPKMPLSKIDRWAIPRSTQASDFLSLDDCLFCGCSCVATVRYVSPAGFSPSFLEQLLRIKLSITSVDVRLSLFNYSCVNINGRFPSGTYWKADNSPERLAWVCFRPDIFISIPLNGYWIHILINLNFAEHWSLVFLDE